jgi:hypothetical protein
MKNQHIINFELPNETTLKLGDVVYTVDYKDKQSWTGVCPVCNNEKKLTVNGFQFTCPKCNGYGGDHSPVLMVSGYCVRRWRVSGFTENLRMYEWNPAGGHSVEIEIRFTNVTRTSSGESFELNAYSQRGNKGFDKLQKLRGDGYSNEPIFFVYADAVKRADELNAEQAAIVTTYNAEHGTAFEFVKPEYDTKSK